MTTCLKYCMAQKHSERQNQAVELTLTASGTSQTAAGSIRTRRVTSVTIASVFLNLKNNETTK